jgi:hypothetical protein
MRSTRSRPVIGVGPLALAAAGHLAERGVPLRVYAKHRTSAAAELPLES